MSLFMVDSEKCNRDGICVETCPAQIINRNGSNGLPVPAVDADENCINCGHCVAVCPTGAISLFKMNPEECSPVQQDLLPTPEQVEHFFRTRRSIRTYTENKVDRQILTKLIRLAAYAPSGHNTQPVRWKIIYDTGEVRRLAGLVVDWMRHVIEEQPDMAASMHLERVVASWEDGNERICRGAPHVIIAHAPKNLRPAMAACTIALAHLELAASAFGLGVCWAGYFNAASNLWPPMTAALKLPEGHASFGAMMIGYPKYKYHRIPLRNEPKISWC
ncbi:MAG: nitroreductase family protein [Deltaproteobacteria bacterium]|nr:nitroreductase family protein [Deltaproteobacteria bacterium]